MKQYGLAIERWDGVRRHDVFGWLESNFGPEGDRWGQEFDYGLENVWMNEDVYILYCLRWV